MDVEVCCVVFVCVFVSMFGVEGGVWRCFECVCFVWRGVCKGVLRGCVQVFCVVCVCVFVLCGGVCVEVFCVCLFCVERGM